MPFHPATERPPANAPAKDAGRIVALRMRMQWCAYVGLRAFAVAWIPQSIETIKAGRCDVNGLFLMLSMTGSLALMLYALMRGDAIFSTVNALTTLGALVNIYYRQFPRISSGS